MKRRFRSHSMVLAATLACLHILLPCRTKALENVAQDGSQPTQADNLVNQDPSGRVTVKFQRGQRIYVDNPTTGPIVIIGWDHDYIEAFAVSDRGAEEVRVQVESGNAGSTVSVVPRYLERDGNEFFRSPFDEVAHATRRIESQLGKFWDSIQDKETFKESVRSSRRDKDGAPQKSAQQPVMTPPSPPPSPQLDSPRTFTQPLDVQANRYSRPGEIFLEVKVPRYAEIDVIRVLRSEVLVAGVETAITVDGDRSAIRLDMVGSAEVRTRTGNVEIDTVKGLADVVTNSGAILVKNAGADVRALSVSGRIEVQCAKGRVDVSNTDGPITLTGVTGDVSATATYSTLRVSGRLRGDGRYYLKSMSGSVQMETPENIGGFTASLTSYRGGVESDFPLKSRDPVGGSSMSRRLSGRFGNGQAQITLDSFDGTVRLVKVPANSVSDCR